MIGNGYWSVGIKVRWRESRTGGDQWGAVAEYLDNGFCDDDADARRISTQGEMATCYVATRYLVEDGETVDGLTVAVDTIKAEVERMGIAWNNPTIYFEGDGENPEWPPPPGWRELLRAQAERLGWRSIYGG